MHVVCMCFLFWCVNGLQRHLLVIHMDWILTAAVTFQQSIQFVYWRRFECNGGYDKAKFTIESGLAFFSSSFSFQKKKNLFTSKTWRHLSRPIFWDEIQSMDIKAISLHISFAERSTTYAHQIHTTSISLLFASLSCLIIFVFIFVFVHLAFRILLKFLSKCAHKYYSLISPCTYHLSSWKFCIIFPLLITFLPIPMLEHLINFNNLSPSQHTAHI